MGEENEEHVEEKDGMDGLCSIHVSLGSKHRQRHPPLRQPYPLPVTHTQLERWHGWLVDRLMMRAEQGEGRDSIMVEEG